MKMHIEDNKRVGILGSYIDCLTMDETISRIDEVIKKREPVQHVVLNAAKINLLKKDEQLRTIINQCDIINADGSSIVLAGRLLGIDIPERVTGIDLFGNLIELADRKGYRVYYFGAEEEVVSKVVRIHQERYKNLNIVGYRNGFFSDEESETIANKINMAKPDILFVAFSSPKKEYWIHQFKDNLSVPFVMGVGGSFDVLAGKTKRAPLWMQHYSLEWFYRFIQEPRRMFRRYIIGNVVFLRHIWSEKWKIIRS